MKNLLLVEHGGDSKSFIFDMLKDKNLNIFVAATYIPEWLPFYVPKEQIIITDTYEPTKLIEDVKEFTKNKRIHFDAVGTFYEHVVVQTALLGESLEVIHLDVNAARRSSSNKLSMRQTCLDNGIPTPKFLKIENPSVDNLRETLKSFGLPAVIKPIFGSQSYGVKKIESPETLEDDIKEIINLTSKNQKEVFKNFNGTFLIEKYLSGKVVSIDGIVQNNKVNIAGMVEFIMGKEPHFTQEANYIPARITGDLEKECHEMATKVIKALGFDNCGFHCEMRLTENGPMLIEIAARLPGGPLQLGYNKSYGYNLASDVVDMWLGENINLVKTQKKYILQKAVFTEQKGLIKEINGLEKIKDVNGIWDFILISNKGEETVTYPLIPKPLYYYAAVANSPEELETLGKFVEENVKFTIL